MPPIPPHNTEAEQSVLASMMIEEQALHAGLEYLRSPDFYRPAHQEIFEALEALAMRREQCDLITLQEELRKRGKLEDCGGTEYLMAIIDVVPTAANVRHYAEIVATKAQLRRIIASATNIVAAAYAEEPDVAEQFANAALEATSSSLRVGPQLVSAMLHQHLELIESRQDKDTSKLFSWGLPTIDRSFGKLGEAQFIVAKGKRGKGKTHLAVHLARQCAVKGRATVLYSLEMSAHQMIDRLMGCFSGLDARMFKHANSEEEWSLVAQAAGMLHEASIYICDDESSVADMHHQCRRLKLQNVDLGLVIVDFAELIQPPPGMRSEEQELKTNARMLGHMANDLDCTVILLSQVNDQGGERGSRGIGNRADLLLGIIGDDPEYVIDAEKNRFGPGFAVACGIDKSTSRIWEINREFD